jgi:hypothetical protein
MTRTAKKTKKQGEKQQGDLISLICLKIYGDTQRDGLTQTDTQTQDGYTDRQQGDLISII